ncbi:MAG: hypothetical protein E7653_02110 [Ruminococcaceae bacterium]|nr:hypothetical protein [Oscillospiraceae bacterium]
MSCITSINVTPKTITLKVGDWYYCACAEITPSDADCTDVVWHSDDPDIASVNESNGYIFANSLGTTTIYATTTDGSECCDCMTVTVSDTIPVTMVSLNNSSLSIEEGTSNLLVATVYPLNASDSSVTWSSDNEGVAFVGEDGTVCGMSTGDTYITATSNSNPNISAHCHVTVTGDILVQSISIRLDGDEIDENNNIDIGNSFFARAIITPTDATNHCVSWSSSNPSVATVISNTGLVTTLAEGSAVITATACDGSGVSASVTITVRRIPITKFEICPQTCVLNTTTNKTAEIKATILPWNASDKRIVWDISSTAADMEVDEENNLVRVTAKRVGSPTVTARTVDGNLRSTCKIAIDSRQSVFVTKETGDFFTVSFEGGPVWKSIGCDLTLDENRSGYSMDPLYGQLSFLNKSEKRFLDNFSKFFSKKELALLYLLDPYGVEFYMKSYDIYKVVEQFPDDYPDYNSKLRRVLNFKDELYEEIFGVYPSPFILSDNGERMSISGRYDRLDYYRDSELIFGAHNVVDVIELLEHAADIILELFDKIIPDDSWIQVGVDVAQAAKTFLFASSIKEGFSEVIADYLDEYIDNSITDAFDGEIKIMEWPNSLLNSIYELTHGINDILNLKNLKDLEIYDKVNRQDSYIVQFCAGSNALFTEDIIELCSND